ncbi:hypothetical protein BHM03_00021498 [Ensete ventricosum]|nr:hypothetical protein BHM03_00021498 [Ensete ventricosum]
MAKKSSTREVFICSAIPRLSYRRSLRPSAKNAMKKKSSHRLAVRRRRRPRLFLFLFLLPCFFFPCRNQIDIAHRERRQRSAYRSAGRPTPIPGGKIRNGRPCN